MSQWLKSLFRTSSNATSHYIPSNYDKLTRPQLIAKIKALEDQLSSNTHVIKLGKNRPFDMTQYSQQRIALKVAYLGWNYSGFAAQGDEISTPTVEGQIFKALEACKLITHPDQCNFSRCGRTDKGVSGLGQVIALDVRNSNRKQGQPSTTSLPYIEILNRLLPNDIRILAWAPVDPTFNARFDCKSRTYKYFFQKGSLDLDLMRKAGNLMMGSHDFRNFCRLDPSKNITNYKRTVVSLDINPVTDDFYHVELKGNAFLWHQVRCMMAILFLVGQKLEHPNIVLDLLNKDVFPARPEYPMASDLPLLLYDCEFENMSWIYANENDQKDIKIPTPLRTWRHLNEFWSSHVIKSLLYKTCMNQVEAIPMLQNYRPCEQSTVILGAGKAIRTSHYRPLKDRPLADTDQVKKEKYRIKQLKKQK